jgi:ureidoacrylate peracid hydrolase
MPTIAYEKQRTALLVVDPYNDFISEGGKIWPRIKAVAEANSCVPHMLQVLNAAREARLHVFYAMHHRYRSGDYETWKYVAPIQKTAWRNKSFEYGTWGGEIVPSSCRVLAKSWPRNTGAPAASPIPTWICSSRSSASISSSSSD